MPLADGFAAGLQVLPEVVPARGWLVHVWGPETALADIEEAAELEAAVRAHYYGVARTLEEDPEQYRPLLEIDRRDGGVFWKPWVLGFVRAIRMRPAAWVRIESSNDLDVQEALLVIQRLYEAANGTSGLAPEGLVLDEMASILICGMVRELSAVCHRRTVRQGVWRRHPSRGRRGRCHARAARGGRIVVAAARIESATGFLLWSVGAPPPTVDFRHGTVCVNKPVASAVVRSNP